MRDIFEGTRVVCVAAAGFAAQMTNWEATLKVGIGVLTVLYLTLKISKFIWRWSKDLKAPSNMETED